MIEVEQFRADATAWLAEQKPTAPPDWGAIMPAERRDQGMEWQQRLHAAGYAGIHWPVEYGGQGLTVGHHQAWMECCADAGVPPFLNMVGLVLAGGSLQLFGTEEQKEAHLPRDRRGASGCGASCSPSPAPAPTSPHCRPGPTSTATSGS